MENLTLTGTAALNGTGNSANNVITGTSGANVLDGGAGDDTLIGGKGNDTYIVDSINDVVTELSGEGTDTIRASVDINLGVIANVENLTLTSIGNFAGWGNSLNNIITGNSDNNSLDGNAGTDTLIGGAGDDTYTVDTTTDTITEAASAGSDTVQSSVSFSLAAIANVENLTLIGAAIINGTGNTLANKITGNSFANVLNGGDGIDTLVGGAGNDTYTNPRCA